jgi:hypothetical protein
MTSPNAKRTAKRERAARPFRLALIEEVGRCECCGKRKPAEMLAVHEIACGSGLRQKALDKRFAVLVLCNPCHAVVQIESKAKQLARLYLSRAADYSLESFWTLRNRREVPTQQEVDLEIQY